MYDGGYVFTRIGRGVMQQTRSIRVDLSKFKLSSENKRILKKVSGIALEAAPLPLSLLPPTKSSPLPNDSTVYDYNIGKIAKDFYEKKFGPNIMSAQKIKIMLTDGTQSNFNLLLRFKVSNDYSDPKPVAEESAKVAPTSASANTSDHPTPPGGQFGFTICHVTPTILHYSYPFYDLNSAPKDMGLAMMITAIQYAKDAGLRYVYLGSLQRPSDTYKFQFSGLEWFNGQIWSDDLEKAKIALSMKNEIASLPKRLHVIGICGVTTSALAIAFQEKGVAVTGSDKGFFPPISTELDKHKVSFYAGWHPEKMFGGILNDKITNGSDSTNIFKSDENIVMVGTASGTNNPETAFAKEKGLPIYSYPEIIGKYFAKERSIVCVGTWGKTSSSAMLSFILSYAKYDPTYMFGGVSLSHSAAKLTDSKWSVFEGDEYKSSPTDERAKFFHYRPTDLLLTAISWDHADLYPTEAEYFNAFKKLLVQIPRDGIVVACADNEGTMKTLGSYAGKTIFYGRDLPPARKIDSYFGYKNVTQTKNGLDLAITHQGAEYPIHSPMLGLYQAENITGCFAMAHSIGIPAQAIAEAISLFKGLKRRMEKRFEAGQQNITVIDDIAHSPEKASSVLQTLRSICTSKIICIFEPNIGGRSRESVAKYDNAFNNADVVIIPRLTKLKVKEGEKDPPMEGDELAQAIAKTHQNVKYIDDDEKLVAELISNTQEDDTIAFLGSHGFRGMIEETVDELTK